MNEKILDDDDYIVNMRCNIDDVYLYTHKGNILLGGNNVHEKPFFHKIGTADECAAKLLIYLGIDFKEAKEIYDKIVDMAKKRYNVDLKNNIKNVYRGEKNDALIILTYDNYILLVEEYMFYSVDKNAICMCCLKPKEDIEIVDIQCNRNHDCNSYYVLDDKGIVYCMHYPYQSERHQLFNDFYKLITPYLFTIECGRRRIKKISSILHDLYMLTDTGRIVICDSNAFIHDTMTTGVHDMFTDNRESIFILRDNCTLTSNVLCAMGINIHGQMGVDSGFPKVNEFTRTNLEDVKTVYVDRDMTMALKNDNSLWMTGLDINRFVNMKYEFETRKFVRIL